MVGQLVLQVNKATYGDLVLLDESACCTCHQKVGSSDM